MGRRPAVDQLVVPGATDIEVSMIRWSEWQLRYRAPEGSTPWITVIGHQLELQGWSSPDQAAYTPLNRTYSRAISLGFLEVWEWRFLTFDPLDPTTAQIRMRRWIAVPGLRFQMASSTTASHTRFG